MRYLALLLVLLALVTPVMAAPAPVADFSGTPQEVCIYDIVYFEDMSTNDPTSWKWNFGDGSQSAEQFPSHVYTDPGLYTVSLKALNAFGSDTEIKYNYINVSTCGIGSGNPWCENVDMFFWNMSDDIPGYRVLNNIPEPSVQHTINTASFDSASGEVLLGTWITPQGSPGVETLAPGLWRFRTYMRASSDYGVTSIQFHAINRSADGTETDLFYGNAITEDIVRGTTPSEYLLSYARRNSTTFFPGDRLVIRATASTDSAAARTVSMDVGGNTNASMVSVSYFVCEDSTLCCNSDSGGGEAVGAAFGLIGGLIAAVICCRRKRKNDEDEIL